MRFVLQKLYDTTWDKTAILRMEMDIDKWICRVIPYFDSQSIRKGPITVESLSMIKH